MKMFLPANLDRETLFPAAFLTAIPAFISLMVGMLVLKMRPADIESAMLAAAVVGFALAYAVSIRGGDSLFCVTMGCTLLTMLIGLLTLTNGMPWFLAHAWVIIIIVLAILALRLVLEGVMPRAEQLAS